MWAGKGFEGHIISVSKSAKDPAQSICCIPHEVAYPSLLLRTGTKFIDRLSMQNLLSSLRVIWIESFTRWVFSFHSILSLFSLFGLWAPKEFGSFKRQECPKTLYLQKTDLFEGLPKNQIDHFIRIPNLKTTSGFIYLLDMGVKNQKAHANKGFRIMFEIDVSVENYGVLQAIFPFWSEAKKRRWDIKSKYAPLLRQWLSSTQKVKAS